METVHFMQTTPPRRPPVRQDRPPLRLPFEKRKIDFATWTYIHRAGICITVIALLLFGIAFVSFKISTGSGTAAAAVYVDFVRQDEAEEQQQPEMQHAQDGNYADYSNVSNRISNENATNKQLNSNLRDAHGSNAQDLYDEADKLNERMKANRDVYQQGLDEVGRMGSGSGGGRSGMNRGGQSGRTDGTQDGGANTGGGDRRQDARVDGAVTVSYSFVDPVRNGETLIVPAYTCKGGGTVVVDAVLDINGYVTSAVVNRASSTSDECMRSTAVKAALGSRFNLDVKAPAKHKGTITYVFIPQ